ncbi:MAG: leucine-rich repeat domain-containing protein [Cyanobacteria bacterium]|nr:leucine-rich repeat domain-containing protein [Cyanobacteriota bacterium]
MISPEELQALIDRAHAEVWQKLDLSGKGLTEIPESIAQLSNLTNLYLGSNQITEIPESIAQLSNLTSLHLSSNQITEIPESIAQLSNLTNLYLGSNQITEIPESIAQLSNLTELDLSFNQITEIPDSISQLSNLTELDLAGNQITEIPDSIAQLFNLTAIELSENQITEIPNSIGQLSNLETIDLSNNQIMEIPDSIAQLSDLRSLNLFGNQITEIPDSIAQLSNLEVLNLSNNKIQSLPASIKSCQKLNLLDLRGNPIPIPNIILGDPIEYIPGDRETILNFYFKTQDTNDRTPLYEAKLLIVGEGEAGKTTLAKKLQNPEFKLEPDQNSTEGIDVIQWEFDQPDGSTFRTNIWDFGGQEIMHHTHQFFLTERSLYLLVVDDRRENPNFNYWLNVIRVLTNNSPVLIIQNEKGGNKCTLNESELRGEFRNLKEFFPLNLASDPEKLQTLQHHIQNRLTQLPQVRENWPTTWVRIRHAFENYHQNYISLHEYQALCRTNRITNPKEMLQISKALHELGICLHFQTTALKHHIILKPEWVTNAIYKIVRNEVILAQNGCFTTQDLEILWSAPEYAEVQDELLELMKKFNLCYPLIGTPGTHIAPQLLPITAPDYTDLDFTDSLTLTYRYEFMPKGLIFPFIVGMYRLIDRNQRLVWRNGVILHDGNAHAEIIESDSHREIQIRVTGFNKRTLLDQIRQKFRDIHATYDDRLTHQEFIPCNCTTCKTSPKPHRYILKTLERYLNIGRKFTITCDESFEDVNIRNLISDFPDLTRTDRDDSDREEGHSAKAYEHMREIAKLAVSRDINLKQEQIVTTEKTQIWNGDRIEGDKVMGDKDTIATGNKMRTGNVAGDAIAVIAIASEVRTQQEQERSL